MRLGTGVVCTGLLLLGSAVQASAQSLKLGIGPSFTTWGGVRTDMTRSALLMGAVELRPEAVFGFRVGGLAGMADYSYVGILPDEDPQTAEPRRIDMGMEPLLAADASVVVRKPGGRIRPYALLGLGFNYFRPWEAYPETDEDMGWLWGFGLAADLNGREWFVEMTPRYYGVGDRFMNGAPSYAPVTLGISF